MMILLMMVGLLQGCVVAAVGGAAVATKTATDPRTTGTQVDDTSLYSRVNKALKNDEEVRRLARILVTSYQGDILLVGQSPTKELIDRAVDITRGVEGVKEIYNKVHIGPKVSAGTITDDTWITTKVRTDLLLDKYTKSRKIKVVTENGEVFLLGVLPKNEASRAAKIASQISGVKKVIMIFDHDDANK